MLPCGNWGEVGFISRYVIYFGCLYPGSILGAAVSLFLLLSLAREAFSFFLLPVCCCSWLWRAAAASRHSGLCSSRVRCSASRRSRSLRSRSATSACRARLDVALSPVRRPCARVLPHRGFCSLRASASRIKSSVRFRPATTSSEASSRSRQWRRSVTGVRRWAGPAGG